MLQIERNEGNSMNKTKRITALALLLMLLTAVLCLSLIHIFGDEKGFVTGMECVEMELGEPDASGRRRPVEKKGSNFVLDVDCAVIAIGNSPNPLIRTRCV